MTLKNSKFRQIVIDVNNYKSLKNLGKAGDSFNDVIGKIINELNSDGISHHQSKGGH